MKTFTITRYETLATTISVTAGSEDEAARIADTRFRDELSDPVLVNVWYEYEPAE